MAPGFPYLTDAHVASSIDAASEWNRDADVPDVLDFADLKARPDLVRQSLQERCRREWVLGLPRPITFQKPNGGARRLVALDPLAELLYREVVGGVVGADAALSEGVLNARVEEHGSSWRVVPWRPQNKLKRELVAEMERCRGGVVATIDVSNHFDTVDPHHLSRVLHSAGISDRAVSDCINVVVDFSSIRGFGKGLPIGPEGSAPLGTYALLPVDRALREAGYSPIRWMDDLTLLVQCDADFEHALDLVSAQLERGGQAPNLDKSGIFGSEDLPEASGGSLSDFSGSADAAQVLRSSVAAGVTDRVTHALAYLRGAGDRSAVAVLEQNPWVLERIPKQAAGYLRRVCGPADWEPFVEFLQQDVCERTAGMQLHLSRSIPKSVVSPSLGSWAFESGVALNRRQLGPVGDALLMLASRSSEKPYQRRGRALEAAESFAELRPKRALIAAFVDGGIGRRDRLGLAHLRGLDQEVAPTVDWVLSA